MDVLEGLLFINGIDVYNEYGVYLTEENAGDHKNYDALLALPVSKGYTSVDFREEDGEKLPDDLPPQKWEARDVSLTFALVAASKTDFLSKYKAFIAFMKSGYLTFSFPELSAEFKFYYKNGGDWDQLTNIDDNCVASRFPIVFREPHPSFYDN